MSCGTQGLISIDFSICLSVCLSVYLSSICPNLRLFVHTSPQPPMPQVSIQPKKLIIQSLQPEIRPLRAVSSPLRPKINPFLSEVSPLKSQICLNQLSGISQDQKISPHRLKIRLYRLITVPHLPEISPPKLKVIFRLAMPEIRFLEPEINLERHDLAFLDSFSFSLALY